MKIPDEIEQRISEKFQRYELEKDYSINNLESDVRAILQEALEEKEERIDAALDFLDNINASGPIEYGQYSELHDLISLITSKPLNKEWLDKKRAENPEERFQKEYINDPIPEALGAEEKKEVYVYREIKTKEPIAALIRPIGHSQDEERTNFFFEGLSDEKEVISTLEFIKNNGGSIHEEKEEPVPEKKEECKHEWDKITGRRTKAKPWAGIRSRVLRICKHCGEAEEFENGRYGVFGWYHAKTSKFETFS